MKSYNEKLNKNILVGYIYNILINFNITNGIWVIYLSFKGLGLMEIGITEGVYHLTSFISEIPTGALADVYGRKFSLVLARISALISAALMMISTDIVGFSIAFAFCALANTLNSGASDSLVYDSLKQLDRHTEYKKMFGGMLLLIEISKAAAVILGGILSDKSFIYAYIACLIIETMALITAVNFTEPKIKEEREERVNLLHQMKDSIVILKDRKLVMYLIMFSALIGTVGTTVYFYCQKYFETLGYSKTVISICFALSCLISGISSKYAYKVENRLKGKGIVMLLPVINTAAIIGLSLSSKRYTVVFFLIISVVEGLTYPIFSDYINSLIPSEYRATILSMESCFFSIFMIIIFPLVGFISEIFGMTLGFVVATGLYIPLMIFIVLKLKKHEMKNIDEMKNGVI